MHFPARKQKSMNHHLIFQTTQLLFFKQFILHYIEHRRSVQDLEQSRHKYIFVKAMVNIEATRIVTGVTTKLLNTIKWCMALPLRISLLFFRQNTMKYTMKYINTTPVTATTTLISNATNIITATWTHFYLIRPDFGIICPLTFNTPLSI